jgi:hypothetical protein
MLQPWAELLNSVPQFPQCKVGPVPTCTFWDAGGMARDVAHKLPNTGPAGVGYPVPVPEATYTSWPQVMPSGHCYW